ncbi:MAG: Gfo/Idh/MocA family oxidoreductase [Bacteroidota bacterium]|nr:Gfo/Idh/MocA family oxidoreductase [Bacteroidota bacterium]MDP4246273.1 Gfo/Idh/MocA family oxidoreductase [Bacteroidota bacterium]MDP4257853.1 Gfo/Idh/MocA family oxidoreductase [Bacteroidota bacterium]
MSATRRQFVKNMTMATAGIAMVGPERALAAREEGKSNHPGREERRVRIGIIGTGLRGQSHLGLALRRSDTDIVAICDVDAKMLQMADALLRRSGKPMPKVFTGDNHAYRRLLELKELDAILIATPWEWHAPMILDALAAGIRYVATEVVLGITMDEHWDVVKAAEQHKAQVMMLENVCYRRDVMAVLNMVRRQVFGEIIHLQGGYQHDLRGIKFNNGGDPHNSPVEFGEKAFSEARWRTNHSVHRNGDLYPTHGVGPLAMMIDINRGNRFLSLCSFSSKARGLHNYIVKNGGADHPNASVRFSLGDVVTTQIRCANGETILLQHDTDLPRPYSLGFRVQGTNGLWMDVNHGIYIEGVSKAEDWDAAQSWYDRYDHPLWQTRSKDADGAGHGGMDFFVLHAFIESVKRDVPTPLDVYDAATWSAISPLSESSIEMGNERVEFPDFTGGQWMYRKNDFARGSEF